ncbi:hypothetical protein PYW07_013376 [Mythimna separata]|uniref:C2H2-type domain-containing protein n=1 Tax=Mythimna separata TaxID=271217 RepID=A0AAD7Y6K0_MYTSE|nr:hypothetical protein PYW07_013376 [Mythimna separata]
MFCVQEKERSSFSSDKDPLSITQTDSEDDEPEAKRIKYSPLNLQVYQIPAFNTPKSLSIYPTNTLPNFVNNPLNLANPLAFATTPNGESLVKNLHNRYSLPAKLTITPVVNGGEVVRYKKNGEVAKKRGPPKGYKRKPKPEKLELSQSFNGVPSLQTSLQTQNTILSSLLAANNTTITGVTIQPAIAPKPEPEPEIEVPEAPKPEPEPEIEVQVCRPFIIITGVTIQPAIAPKLEPEPEIEVQVCRPFIIITGVTIQPAIAPKLEPEPEIEVQVCRPFIIITGVTIQHAIAPKLEPEPEIEVQVCRPFIIITGVTIQPAIAPKPEPEPEIEVPEGTELVELLLDPEDWFPTEPYKMVFSRKKNPKWKDFPYQCEHCFKGYRVASTLITHSAERHGCVPKDLAIPCPCCPHVSTRRKHHKKHLESHESRKHRIFCLYCLPAYDPSEPFVKEPVKYPYDKFPQYWYASEESLRLHKKRKHPYSGMFNVSWFSTWRDAAPNS